MSRPAPIHIIFYSNRCEWSKAFLEEISKTNYHQEFRFICVDPGPNRPALPSWLKQTPTLVISGEPEPRTNSDVMNWLYERKMKDGGNKGSGGGSTAGQGPAEPEPYLDMEMGGGYGDQYYSTMPQGISKSQIPAGQEDLYILKSQVIPPVCPACPTSSACPRQEKCPPCPACARCPEPSFECKKVPNYNAIESSQLPIPDLSDFSSFGM